LDDLQAKSLDEANNYILKMIMENEENSKYLANLQQQETQMKEEMKI